MKNKFIKNIILLFFLSLIDINLLAEEVKIDAKEIIISDNGNKIIAKGEVDTLIQNSYKIESEIADYDKTKKILIAEGNVIITDLNSLDKIYSKKIEYHETKRTLLVKGNSEFNIESYQLKSSNVVFNDNNKTVQSKEDTFLKDTFGNSIKSENFKFSKITNNLILTGKVKITDLENNKHFIENLIIDTKKKRMAGENFKTIFDKEIFGNIKNDPRLTSNSVKILEGKTMLNKGVFTSCKKRGNKCPPWQFRADKITHDKKGKKIIYDNAWLDLFDKPVIYFPKFFHPDPTVKRQSGFLIPSFNDSSALGFGVNIPYFLALDSHKDLTIKPKIFFNENPLIQAEYRHKTKNSYSIVDTSFNQGYKENTGKGTDGNRKHLFLNSKINLNPENFQEGYLELDFQTTTNDTYLKVYDLKSDINNSNSLLTSKIELDLVNENSDINFIIQEQEDLTTTVDKKETFFPRFEYNKRNFVLSDELSPIDFRSISYFKNYKTNKKEKIVANDVFWNSSKMVWPSGLLTSLESNLKNINYRAENISSLKSEENNYEISGVLAVSNTLPLIKDTQNYRELFSPKIMFRFAPFPMKNYSDKDLRLNYSNLFSLNKIDDVHTIESGHSITLGGNYKKKHKEKEYNLIEAGMGQVFSLKENKDIPDKSSLNQKTSELVGHFDYFFNENSNFKYKFSLDHNFNDLNYQELSTVIVANKIVTEFTYLNEKGKIGNENFIGADIEINIDDSNSLKFNARKNYKTNMTEFYNLIYQYEYDCMIAALEYSKNFYSDRDVEPTSNLMFKIKLQPLGTTFSSPSFQDF